MPNTAAGATLVVDTNTDTFADDGRLSLREALALANATAGADTVRIDPALGEDAVIVLTKGALDITEDAVIEGGGTTLRTDAFDPKIAPDALIVDTAVADLRDLTIEATYGSDGPARGVIGYGADIVLRGSTIRGFSNPDAGTGAALYGGSLVLDDSAIADTGGSYGQAIVARYGATVRLSESRVTGNAGGYAPAIFVEGDLTVERSTIDGNEALSGPSAVLVDGDLVIENSTIARNETVFEGYRPSGYGAIEVTPGSRATIDAATIAGNIGYDATSSGLYVPDGAAVTIANSLIAGNVARTTGDAARDVMGAIASGGGNVFGEDGGELRQIFADLARTDDAFDPLLLPILADNGGPTPTLALVNDAGNPAIGAAFDTPTIDQRGFGRDGTPDAGAFEAVEAPLPGLPPLAEKVAVEQERINGVDPAALAADGPLQVTFLNAVAAQDNALGYYVVGADGTIGETGFLFEGSEVLDQGEAATTIPGPAAGERVGLFLLADGGALNEDLEGPFAFRGPDGEGPAAIDGPRPRLFDGDGREVEGRVLHAVDFDAAPGNRLNPKDGVRALSGKDPDGALIVAFEDKPFAPDNDFNDFLVKIEPFG